MLEVGWSELLVIAIVMIVVVGPKDLPRMLRTFAGFAKKARGMANEFQTQFSDAMRDAEMDDLRKSIEDVRSLNPKNALRDAFDPIRKTGEDVKRELQGAKTEIKSGVENSIAPAASTVVASPAVIAPAPEPVKAPEPSIALPNAAPAELAPVAAKPKTAPKKPAVTKAEPVQTEPAEKPKASKPRAKKAEAKA